MHWHIDLKGPIAKTSKDIDFDYDIGDDITNTKKATATKSGYYYIGAVES